MPYWAAAQLQPQRDRLAGHFLRLNGYQVYCPRVRSAHNGSALLFPAYAFVSIELQWRAAARAPGVLRVVLNGNGDHPAHVPDRIIDELRAREDIDGLITLPAPPKPRGLRPGAKVRITQGPLRDQFGIYAGQRAHERVAILLTLLGAQRPLVLARSAVMPVP